MERTDQEFGAEVIRIRSERLVHRIVALSSEVTDEAVHQTRVESRRTRAALKAFQKMFPPRPFNSLYRSVRRITLILGAMRETAVSLKLLNGLEQEGCAGRSCVQYLEKRLGCRLKKQEEQIQKEFKHMDPFRVRSKFDFLLSIMDSGNVPGDARYGAHSARSHGSQPFQPTLFQMRENVQVQGFHVIAAITEPISRYRTRQLFDSAKDSDLHSLRIAAKKARYAMEIYSSVWPGGLSRCIEKTRQFQETAGLYHDWSVLRVWIEKEVGHLSKGSAGLAFEIGALAERIEFRKTELRNGIRTSLAELQKTLARLPGPPGLPAVLRQMNQPMIARSGRIRAGGRRKRA